MCRLGQRRQRCGQPDPLQRPKVAVRTGDTTQRERQQMVRKPPHILIITPESLYLMLTGKTGRNVLATARAVIVDELHALIDTKRGAHLMLSLARLDVLCGRPLQPLWPAMPPPAPVWVLQVYFETIQRFLGQTVADSPSPKSPLPGKLICHGADLPRIVPVNLTYV